MISKEARITLVDGSTFAATADSNHWVTMDGGSGTSSALRPKELLLIALGGCTGSDVVSILGKKQVRFEGFDLRIRGTVRDEYPKVFTDIHIEYIVYGEGIDRAAVERAIELSTTKYCSISAMLQPGVRITHSYRIEPRRTVTPAVPESEG
jgi:putative redox protein